MEQVGKVYLIPTVLSPEGLHTIPPYVTAAAQKISVFFVENERTARRYLKALDRSINIDSLQILLMQGGGATGVSDTELAKKFLLEGKDIGVMSEAGCPAIADPGHRIVLAAHSVDAPIIPMVGPNSMLMALIASGMNGQNFQFVGYLPVKPGERIKAIKELELESIKKHQTEMFIETPYRNNHLLRDLLASCKDTTLVCVAADITAPEEYIKTKTVKEWKKQELPELHKRPAIFLLLAQ
ncbi:SAM-dependent methyltransferase [Chitinophaga sancti]|uniref:16S rRNA (Cytidine1402-2'-O)-methyltransferase n=1 Tax=Chitinophaga sancti TaxID=1004 RepID=A0A1K1S9T1_9BACT|nr:SAM-dependent methyltransferase [Chitinophaga sancti]WQD60897.1 SAM-dependent methyltransferase [Chitinophaga sancti]WQG86975.1 SAM-dependent methyltransferase [Chitinophaga sancti]SFW81107.1 16S rRNA (cytidine1402-2'-O)-methyltransferase [Chitinophaga sancti]